MRRITIRVINHSKNCIRGYYGSGKSKNRLRSVDKTANVVYGGDLIIPPAKKSFGSLLFEQLTKKGRENEIFQVCTLSRYEMTTKEFVALAVALAEKLKEMGVQKGDYIGLIGNNSLIMNTALIGIFLMGAVPFPITSKTSLEELNVLLRVIKPKLFGCEESKIFTLRQALKSAGVLDNTSIFLLNSQKQENVEYETFDEFIGGKRPDVSSFKPATVSKPQEEIALLVKGLRHETYGKGIGITHHNLNTIVARFQAISSLQKNNVILMVQKVMWMSGIYSLVLCCYFPNKLIVMNEFQEVSFMEAIEDYKVTLGYAYSAKLWQVLKYDYAKTYDLSSLSYIQAFDGFLPQSLIVGLKEKYGLTVTSGFGLNELTGLALECDEHQVGYLLPGMYAKVLDSKTLRKVPAHELGEICFKGPTTTKGYVNDPVSTLRMFDKEGFFHSSLFGYYNNEGFFTIIDKVHHFILYKNHKISPKELEGILKSLDAVQDALVAGIPHVTDGYYPMAFVALRKGKEITPKEIVDYVNAKVQDHQKLRGGVVFIKKLPRSRETGALKRSIFLKVLARYQIEKEVNYETNRLTIDPSKVNRK